MVDNVQWLSRASRFPASKGNEMVVKTNSFAIKDRVPFEDDNPDQRIKAMDIPIHAFMPSQEDYDNLKKRTVTIIVQRILKENSALFKSSEVTLHIPHKYGQESSLKTEYVSFVMPVR